MAKRLRNGATHRSSEHVKHESTKAPPVDSFVVTTVNDYFWCPDNTAFHQPTCTYRRLNYQQTKMQCCTLQKCLLSLTQFIHVILILRQADLWFFSSKAVKV